MNVLRSLAVDIAFNTQTNKLLEVDSAVDSVKSNALEAAGNMDDLSDSTSSFSDKMKGVGSFMSDNWLAITAVSASLGGALMKVTGRADELNSVLRRVEIQSDATEQELREMIQGMTDETSDVNQYVESLEELVRAGVRTKDEFEAILPVFDSFGTATGKTMVEGIESMNAVLSALDIPLSDSAEHIDTLTWLTTGTTVSMGDLGRTMRREQGNIRKMGLTFDEIAVAMAALEDEGIKGPRAIMAFQTAIQGAEGDLQEFWAGLGVTSEALGRQNELLLESEGLTDSLADANAQSLGVWDKLKHRLDMAMWSAGSFLEPVKDLGPALLVVGPAIKGITTATSWLSKGFVFATKSVLGFSATLLASPITWVVLGITALIAALILLWKNWDTVTEWISAGWNFFIDGIVFGINWLVDLFTGLGSAAKEWGKSIVDGLIGGIKDKWESAKETVKEFAGSIADGFKSFFGIKSPSLLMEEYGGDITTGLQIGMEDDVPEIPIPEFPDFPEYPDPPLFGFQDPETDPFIFGEPDYPDYPAFPEWPDIPTPETDGSPETIASDYSESIFHFNHHTEVHIHVEGSADASTIKRELVEHIPEILDDYYENLQVRMEG